MKFTIADNKMKFTIFDNGKDSVIVEQVRFPHCKICRRQMRYKKLNNICYDCDTITYSSGVFK